jgi:hypothetical protein
MRCPECGREMQQGSPHDDGWRFQWECYSCGYIQGSIGYKGDEE